MDYNAASISPPFFPLTPDEMASAALQLLADQCKLLLSPGSAVHGMARGITVLFDKHGTTESHTGGTGSQLTFQHTP